jgi:hypothetical protein
MLDTEKDSPAELVYPNLGYIRVSGEWLSVEKMLMRGRWEKFLGI